MKRIFENAKKIKGLLLAVCALGLTLSACVKSTTNTSTNSGIAALAVINACPDGPAVDFYVGASKVNLSSLSYSDYLNYFSTYSGQSSALFYPSGTNTIEAQTTLNLTQSTYYTLFLSNLKASPDLIVLKDSLFKPSSGSTVVRLVNVSPDAPNVDLYIKGGSKIASNLIYKKASPFVNIPLPSGTGYDTLQVVQTGTTTVLATAPVISLKSNADYTVWLYGLANTTTSGQGLNANIMENVYFSN